MNQESSTDYFARLYGTGGGGPPWGGGSKGEGASWASMQAGRTTQYVWDTGGSYDTPLVPFLQYRETREDGFLHCMIRGLYTCNRNFSGEGLRSCLYGMLVASDLVPSGAGVGYLDVDGPFATGLSQGCSRSTTDLIPQRD